MYNFLEDFLIEYKLILAFIDKNKIGKQLWKPCIFENLFKFYQTIVVAAAKN
jgi:hypothetical protein